MTDVAAFRVRLQLFDLAPPLEQPPDQMASRPLLTVSVTTVPVAKLALPVVPTLTLSPAGLEETHSPERPVAVRVSWAVVVVPPPQTFAPPPPPHVCGAVHVPHVSVPPQPSEIVPQFFPCAAQVVGVQLEAGFTVKTADAVPLFEAEMVTRFVAVTGEVVTVKLALVCPSGMTTLGGTLTCGTCTAPQTCGGGGVANVCGGGTTSTAQLTLTATGRSGEWVSSSPAGLKVNVGTTGSASFATGMVVTLTVSNGRDAVWSGGCSSGGSKTKSCSLTLNAATSVTANVQ